MNARLYDPALARMLSPDNLVSDPTNTQAYNRYSYVWNNPMKYTDPSGNDLVGAIIGAVGSAVGAIQNTINFAGYVNCNGTVVAPSSMNVSSPAAQGIGGALSFIGGFINAIQAGRAGKEAGDRVADAMRVPVKILIRPPSNGSPSVSFNEIEKNAELYLSELTGGNYYDVVQVNSASEINPDDFFAVVGEHSDVTKYVKKNLQNVSGEQWLDDLQSLGFSSGMLPELAAGSGDRGIAASTTVANNFFKGESGISLSEKIALVIVHGMGHNFKGGGHESPTSGGFLMERESMEETLTAGRNGINNPNSFKPGITQVKHFFKPKYNQGIVGRFLNHSVQYRASKIFGKIHF